MEAEPVTVTVSGGLGVREMRRIMLCSHVTSACVFAFDAENGLNGKNIWCSYLTSTFAPNVKSGFRTHSLHLFASPLMLCKRPFTRNIYVFL